jgi:hypothetical protein
MPRPLNAPASFCVPLRRRPRAHGAAGVYSSTTSPSSHCFRCAARSLACECAGGAADASGGERAPPVPVAGWVAFEAQLRGRGFFAGAPPGSAAEQQRLKLARARFAQRMARGPPPPPPDPAPVAVLDPAAHVERAAALIGTWSSRAAPDAPASTLTTDAAAGLRAALNALDGALAASDAAALEPVERSRALLLRATAQLELGNGACAAVDARAAAATAPEGSAAWLRALVKLGHALERAGDVRAAIADGYAPALAHDPANAVVRRYHDAARARLSARVVHSRSADEADALMHDPEVMSLASSMASQLLADPSTLAQLSALFPDGLAGDDIDPAQLAALAAKFNLPAGLGLGGQIEGVD